MKSKLRKDEPIILTQLAELAIAINDPASKVLAKVIASDLDLGTISGRLAARLRAWATDALEVAAENEIPVAELEVEQRAHPYARTWWKPAFGSTQDEPNVRVACVGLLPGGSGQQLVGWRCMLDQDGMINHPALGLCDPEWDFEMDPFAAESSEGRKPTIVFKLDDGRFTLSI